MEYTAGNVYKAIDMLAPFGGCMAWDNVGLLVGEPDSAVTGILVTLDVTPAAVAQALEMRMNCIVSHHPIIFHPLKRISARDAAGLCLANGISVISAHTNYDFAPRGVNCALAQMLGLRNIRPFGPEDKEKSWYSIIVFVPKSHAEAVCRTMSEAGAGRQGNYSGCAYMNDGEGRFLPEAGAHPYLGKVGALEKTEETRLEMLCAPECLDAVIAAMRAAHPYEEPAYSILQNHALHRQEVYGMVGELPRPMRPEELAAMSETPLNTRIQYVPTGREILTVAVCGGAGSDFMGEALAAGAEAFLTGEVKHHEWFMAAEQGLCLMAAGHHATEHPAMPQLAKQLRAALPGGEERTILSPASDPRRILADELLKPDSGFAEAADNRVWCWIFGRGIYPDPDDLPAERNDPRLKS